MRLALPHPDYIRPLRSQTLGDMRMMWHPSTSVGVGDEAGGVKRLPRKGFTAKTALHALALDMRTLPNVGGHDGGVNHGHGADLHGYAVEVAHIRKQRLRPCRTVIRSLYPRSQPTVCSACEQKLLSNPPTKAAYLNHFIKRAYIFFLHSCEYGMWAG